MILIAVLFGLALVLVTLTRPSLGLGLAATADMILMQGIQVGGTSVAPESFYFLFILGVPILRTLVSRDAPGLPFSDARPIVALFVLFFSLCLVSSALGGGLERAQGVLTRLPLWALFGLTPVWICRCPRDIERVATTVIWGSILLLGVVLFAGLPSLEEQGGLIRSGYLNPLGHAFALAVVMCAALARRGGWRRLHTVLIVVLALGVAWTKSRGAIISGGLGLVVVAWIRSPGRTKSVFKVGALASGILLLFAFVSGLVENLWGTFLANDGSSNLYRYQIMTLSGRLFVSSPLMGVGIGSMEASGILHSQGLRTLADSIIANDNEYARVLAELGALGVLIVVGWIRFVSRHYVDAVRAVRAANDERLRILALGGGVGIYLVALGLFEAILFSPTGWFYLGLSWACVRVARR